MTSAKERYLHALAEAGLTPTTAAKRYGVASNYFQRNPFPANVESAEFVAGVTGCRPGWLLWGELPMRTDLSAQEALGAAYRFGRASALRMVAEVALNLAEEASGAIEAGLPMEAGALEAAEEEMAVIDAASGQAAPPAPLRSKRGHARDAAGQ